MTQCGWIIMFISVGSVTTLLLWCIFKVLSSKEEPEALHGFEQATPDIDSEES